MYESKKAKTTKIASKRQMLRGDASAVIVVTGERKTRPAEHSLRGMDPKTVEILVDDKIATGG